MPSENLLKVLDLFSLEKPEDRGSCFHDLKSCHIEERFNLISLAPEGRAKSNR